MSVPQAIVGGISLAQGKSAQKKAQAQANSLMGSQKRLLGIQEQAASKYLDYADKYDPTKESDLAMGVYDQAANESLNRDIGRSTVASTARGFAPGQSSDTRGGVSNVLAGRAFSRGQFLGNLKSTESARKLNALSGGVNAAGSLTSAANQYGNMGQMYQQQAAGYDPSGSVAAIGGAFKGMKMPWQKTPNQVQGRWGTVGWKS